MKGLMKTSLVAFSVAVLAACGGGGGSKSAEKPANPPATQPGSGSGGGGGGTTTAPTVPAPGGAVPGDNTGGGVNMPGAGNQTGGTPGTGTTPGGGGTQGTGGSTPPPSKWDGLVDASWQFADGKIPTRNAATQQGGENISPSINIGFVPDKTDKIAIIMDDENAPCASGDGACVHWGVFNLPKDKFNIREGENLAALPGVVLGKAYNDQTGYQGPNPPSAHTYKLTIYALKAGAPAVTAGSRYTRSQFAATWGEHILGSKTLSARYPGDDSIPVRAELQITSSSFADGAVLPAKHKFTDSANPGVSPALQVANLPSGTTQLAIIMDDVSGTGGCDISSPCIHWNAFNLPANTAITEGLSFTPGNSNGSWSTYRGGFTRPVRHTYQIRVFALRAGAPRVQPLGEYSSRVFLEAYKQHIIGVGVLTAVSQ